MWRRGGLIAGSGAGAAVQSARMLSVSGLPDELLDEGMDALDFGICSDLRRRRLLVTQGLDFFETGIIDQHFNQYRGRLGRLSRTSNRASDSASAWTRTRPCPLRPTG